MGDMNDNIREGFKNRRTTRDAKLARILTRPVAQSALRDAERDAKEARRLAEEAKRRAEG